MGSECIPRHASAMTAGIGERTTINRRLLPYGSSFLVGKANHLPCIEDSLHLSAGSFNFLLMTFQGEDTLEAVIEPGIWVVLSACDAQAGMAASQSKASKIFFLPVVLGSVDDLGLSFDREALDRFL